jgi:RimJ/RimL family protein N-acetyltransferase
MPTTVTLRPLAESELSILERISSDPAAASEFSFYGYKSANARRTAFAENGLLTDDRGTLAVVAGSEAVGSVSWHRVDTGPASFTWNIGIGLLTEAQGKGYGTSAQRALVEYLFGYTHAYRIEAQTETENLAEQRALDKAGFTREGVVRGAAFRAGRWRDMVAYSVLRTDIQVLALARLGGAALVEAGGGGLALGGQAVECLGVRLSLRLLASEG